MQPNENTCQGGQSCGEQRELPSFPCGREGVEALLPHRDPFVWVSRILECEPGERIVAEEQSARADETIAQVMRESPFLFQERQTFWRRKWQHDHRWTLLAVFAAMAAVQMAALLLDDSRLSVAGALLTMGLVVMLRNRQADYIEHHLFDDKLDFSE